MGWKKIILGTLGALLIGAFGNGIWEIIVKPFGSWLGRVILDIVTFGSSTVKDHIYIAAAHGQHEGVALFILLFFITFIITMPFYMAIVIYGFKKRFRKFFSNKEGLDDDQQEEKVDVIKARINRSFNVAYVLIGLIFISTGITTIQFLMVVEANRALTFFSQSLTICRPYMEEKQALLLSSQFASIRGRVDFIKIKNELQQIADSKKLTLPDYTPW